MHNGYLLYPFIPAQLAHKMCIFLYDKKWCHFSNVLIIKGDLCIYSILNLGQSICPYTVRIPPPTHNSISSNITCLYVFAYPDRTTVSLWDWQWVRWLSRRLCTHTTSVVWSISFKLNAHNLVTQASFL